MSDTENYRDNAESDARDCVSNFRDEIVEMLLNDGKASDDLLNDYPGGDCYHHESHTDKWYNLQEAAAVLDQLDEYEETDSGLWEGQDMKTALGTCAAFTYANAVYNSWNNLIESVNDEADTIIDEFDTERSELEDAISDLTSEADDAEADADDEEIECDVADELNATAEAARTCAAEKQALLDNIDERKADALREMVDRIAGR